MDLQRVVLRMNNYLPAKSSGIMKLLYVRSYNNKLKAIVV